MFLSEVNTAIKARRNRISLYYILEAHASSKAVSNQVFLLYQGQQWTYSQCYDMVLKFGAWLKQKHGVTKRQIVAMDFMNGPQFVFVWLAIWSLGATPAFVNYNLNGDSLVHSIKTSQTSLLLVEEEVSKGIDPSVVATLKNPHGDDSQKKVEIVVLGADVEAEIHATPSLREPDVSRDGQQPEDVAILIYTSGTTSLPKAAIVSWARVWRSGWIMAAMTEMGPGTRYYSCMPLYHTSCALLCFCCSLVAGSTIAIGRRFSARTFWNEVRESEASIIQYVGETCRYLLSVPPQIDLDTGEDLDRKNNVKLAIGNGLRPDIWQRFRDRFGIDTIVEFYGATESPVGFWNMSNNSRTAGAIGHYGTLMTFSLQRLIAQIEIDWETQEPVRDPANQGFCKKVKVGEPGEVIFSLDPKNPGKLFQGYHGNKKASESRILRDVFKKGDAYFQTGDVVRWDNDRNVFFVDRIGDTYRWKSENISTSEVAEAFGSLPEVHEANVYGLAIPNHDGKAGCVALQLDPSLTKDQTTSLLADTAQHLTNRLQRHAVPLFLRIVPEIERTGTNKQTKVALRKAGLDPGALKDGESLWWLQNGAYVPFGARQWAQLQAGSVKL